MYDAESKDPQKITVSIMAIYTFSTTLADVLAAAEKYNLDECTFEIGESYEEGVITLKGTRLETEREIQDRLEDARHQREVNLQYERRLYESLKAKFEGEKK